MKKPSEGLQSTAHLDARVIAELSEQALKSNYRLIHGLVPRSKMIPMIKANAYGHGSLWAARHLIDMPHLHALGVATLEEGRELRQGLGARYRRVPILVFSGACSWSEAKAQYCLRYGLMPVISSFEDFVLFASRGDARKSPYHLKFNTGMNRLGIEFDRLSDVKRALKQLHPSQRPQGVLTHLAMAEKAENPATLEQVERFQRIRQELAALLPQVFFHLANSSGIWNFKRLGLEGFDSIVRPGIALYGVLPWAQAKDIGLMPVMKLSAKVLQCRKLKAGEAVGYGATWKPKRPAWMATLGIGYADGLHRSMSNQAYADIEGRLRPFRGTISMDLSSIECDESTRVGQWAQILGPSIDIWEQAKSAGTLPYELFTSVSPRVERIHVKRH